MRLKIDFSGLQILEKIPSNFGNSSHILISRKLIGKRIKIIAGKSDIKANKLYLDFFDSEVLERKVKAFGTGAHVILPKQYSDTKLKLIVGENE